jgi:hypothetical protein
MAQIFGFVLVLGWYAMFAFKVNGVTFDEVLLGMLLGIALILSDTRNGKEK